MVYPGLAWKSLLHFHSYVLLADHLTDSTDEIPYELLATLPFAAHIQFGLTEEESRKEAEGFLKIFELPYSEILMYDTVDDAIAAVETGESFTVTPPVFQHAFYAPYLKKFPLLHHTASIGCVWNSKTHNPYLGKIVETLSESVRESELYAQLNVSKSSGE